LASFLHLKRSHLTKVSVVIINFNGRKFLEQFLPSVMASSFHDMEIVVADNASTDDSLDYLRKFCPTVRIIEMKRNHGYAGGYNEALKELTSEYYVLLNSDVEVTPGWIGPVIDLMDSDPQIGACQPKILSYHNKTRFEYAGAAGGWIDCLGYPFARGRIFDICETDSGQYNDIQRIFWASGAALFLRAKLFYEAGGFETYFFAHMEEIDLCWRMQLLGYHIYACPASVVYHIGGGTLPKGNERKVFLNFRNNMIMLAKNLPKRQSFWKIPLRIGMDLISATKSLFAGQYVYFLAVLEAHLAFFKWLLFMQKKSVFPAQRRARLSGWYLHCVAWKHFVEGKERFDEIVGDKR
jgi:GT2 family glycosyltransferase